MKNTTGLINLVVKKKFISIIVLLAVTDLAILLNIGILRQILAFLFLTLVPGILILFILKLNKLGLLEKVVLSVGLSLSFLMLFGFLINQVYFSLGYTTPLSTNSLIFSFNIMLIILSIIAYKTNKEAFSFSLSEFKLSSTEKIFVLLPLGFPLLSIYGMYLMNTANNNVILMILLFLIPAYVILIAALNHKVPTRTYPPIIFLTGLSLLLMLSLRSSHIIGMDAHHEYYLFQLTSNDQQWQVFEKSTLDSCLSISLLPTIYQSLMNVNAEYLFKVLFSLIFSISPLVVYVISKKYIGSFYAFLASFFFMSHHQFLWTEFNARQSMAILFFALAIMAMFHDNINRFGKRALFVVFALSTIVSHYSTTYIFFFVLLLTWIGVRILPRVFLHKKKVAISSKSLFTRANPTVSLPQRNSLLKSNVIAPKAAVFKLPRFKRNITMGVVALFFATVFFWYSQLTEAPFNAGVIFIKQTLTNLSDFFLLELRSGAVGAAFGRDLAQKAIPQKIEFVFDWLTILFIIIGVLTIVRRFRGIATSPNPGGEKLDIMAEKSDAEHLVLSLVCFAILLFSVVFPHISRVYGVSRVYFQMMIPLSMFFVIGGVTMAKCLKKIQPYWVLLTVLIPYFMCTTGVIYQIFDFPREITLNSKGSQYDSLYIHDQESYAAKWLRNNTELENIRIYTDLVGGNRLLSQAGIRRSIDAYSFLEPNKKIDGYIYLRYYNVVDGKLLGKASKTYSITEYKNKLAGKNKIYSNGGSEVWR